MSPLPPFPIHELNRETREYLQKIWRQCGADHPGIFGKEAVFGWGSLAGFLSIVMLLGAIIGLQPRSLFNSLEMQCVLASGGLIGLLFFARALHRRFSSNALGRFAYFDGTWYWEVGAHHLKVTDLS